ncbi:MAG: histidine phosphatase family protein [Candidatus Binatia bacterium]
MSDRSKELWLFRHGETAWTLTRQHTGHSDIPLTEDGRQAAAALGRRLVGRKFAMVLTSPLVRASETCRLAGYGDVARPARDLMEWDYGSDDGRSAADIRKERPGWSIWDDGVKGGETITQVAARAHRALALADKADGDVALFAHAHLLRILAMCWLGLPPQAARHFELGPASTSVLGRRDDGAVIRHWNL